VSSNESDDKAFTQAQKHSSSKYNSNKLVKMATHKLVKSTAKKKKKKDFIFVSKVDLMFLCSKPELYSGHQ